MSLQCGPDGENQGQQGGEYFQNSLLFRVVKSMEWFVAETNILFGTSVLNGANEQLVCLVDMIGIGPVRERLGMRADAPFVVQHAAFYAHRPFAAKDYFFIGCSCRTKDLRLTQVNKIKASSEAIPAH